MAATMEAWKEKTLVNHAVEDWAVWSDWCQAAQLVDKKAAVLVDMKADWKENLMVELMASVKVDLMVEMWGVLR